MYLKTDTVVTMSEESRLTLFTHVDSNDRRTKSVILWEGSMPFEKVSFVAQLLIKGNIT
jgi:hypothetical protein